MKTPIQFIIATLLLTGAKSFAATRLQFLPGDMNFLANILETDIYGNRDSDPEDLYETMNVDEQDGGSMGKGKSIVSPLKDFNLVCAKEKKSCHIVLNRSANTVISSSQKIASFKLTGDAAKAITQKFKLNDRGEAYFMASDKLFRIFGSSDTFIFEVTGQ
ncbi:MAG: hypothetical protein ACXVAX_04980 [Pseudobdellovibrio sp.]